MCSRDQPSECHSSFLGKGTVSARNQPTTLLHRVRSLPNPRCRGTLASVPRREAQPLRPGLPAKLLSDTAPSLGARPRPCTEPAGRCRGTHAFLILPVLLAALSQPPRSLLLLLLLLDPQVQGPLGRGQEVGDTGARFQPAWGPSLGEAVGLQRVLGEEGLPRLPRQLFVVPVVLCGREEGLCREGLRWKSQGWWRVRG